MATEKQIRANQQNARKSTGPITPEGKRKSSRNALTHGFTAETHTMDCESADDYQTLLDEYTNLYNPENEPHYELVRQLAHAQWNLRRTRVTKQKDKLGSFPQSEPTPPPQTAASGGTTKSSAPAKRPAVRASQVHRGRKASLVAAAKGFARCYDSQR